MNKIILDMDPGVDDAQALMVALSTPNVEVLGVTCCHGNVSLDQVLVNMLRILKVCKREDIPVFRGCDRPLIGERIQAGDYHGKDGLGEVPDPEAPDLKKIQGRKAPQALVKLVKAHPGEVTLVATAPLTNLAVAVMLDPSLPKKLKALYIMGGNSESRGNTTVCGEFNFVADPEAAYIVLDRYTCPTYIAPWEFTCKNSLPWKFCKEWFSAKTEKAEFMRKISEFSMKKAKTDTYQEQQTTEGSGFNSCDTYALVAALYDGFVVEQEEVAVSVELHGTSTRGMMVVDHMELLKKKHKAFIMKKVDLKKLKAVLINSLQ